MIVALASPKFPSSIRQGLDQIEKCMIEAAGRKAEIICFPESYIPGYPDSAQVFEQSSPENLQSALAKVCALALKFSITVILPMDWYLNNKLVNLAFVISSTGELLGYQTKNQLDPTEDMIWEPGTERSLFEVNGTKFGITICHEGFRYPESVRWAAVRGAQVVFHPHYTGTDTVVTHLTEWGGKKNPYYEKAMIMRAMENTIYFASVGYAMKYPESATSLIAPDGSCLAYIPYGEEGVLVAEIDTRLATGLLARRFKPEIFK